MLIIPHEFRSKLNCWTKDTTRRQGLCSQADTMMYLRSTNLGRSDGYDRFFHRRIAQSQPQSVQSGLEEMLLSLDTNVDEDLLANLQNKQVKKSTLMTERFCRCVILNVFSRRNQEIQKTASHGQRCSRRSETNSIDLSGRALWRHCRDNVNQAMLGNSLRDELRSKVP